MNFPVAPESKRALVDLTSPVSVVSMLTLSFKDLLVSWSSREAITSLDGRRLSHLGRNTRSGFGFSKFCTTWIFSTGSSISMISSTGSIENRLLVDNEGVRFTCCRGENPLNQEFPAQSGGPTR